MLKVSFINGDVLHITDDKPRLTSLTVFNGHPDIALHYITKEDIAQLLAVLLKAKGSCPTCGQKVE